MKHSCLVLSTVMLILFVIGAAVNAQEWSTPQEIVTGLWSNGPDYGLSIAVDSAGEWHVVYLESSGGYPDTLYIMYVSSTSSPMPLALGIYDSAGVILGEPSIAIDPGGVLHVVYRYHNVVYGVPTPSAIMYMNNVSGSWSSPLEIVSGLDDPTERGLCIAADSAGDWHIVYLDGPEESFIMYANSTVGPVAIASGPYLWEPSIDIDPHGGLHVVYRDYTRSAIMYMNNLSGSWATPQVIVSGLSLYYEDMGLCVTIDSARNWHVVYNDGTEGNNIMYASSTSNSVSIVSGVHLWEPSIDIDPSEGLYVVYRDYPRSAIMYTERPGCGDLAVAGVDLIQVTQHANEFIMNKKTAACVHVTSSFTEQTLSDIEIRYDFGQTYVETGPYEDGVPIQPGENRIYIPGGPVFHDSGATDAWIGAGTGPWLSWASSGGDDNIRAIVDPDSEVAECSEGNNEVTISEFFWGSIDFRVLVVPVYFPDEGEQPYDLSMGDQQGFLLRTYPLAENRFTWNSIPDRPFSGHPDVTDVNHFFTWLYNNVVEPLVREALSRNYQRVVIVLSENWDSVLGGTIGYAIGMLRNPVVQWPVVVLNVNDEGLVAHEIGHTYWLWHPHDIGPPVYEAERFWVENRNYEDICNTFMSYRPPPLWVDSGRYDSDPKTWNVTYGVWVWNLFDQFKLPVGKIAGQSQEVVVLGGIIYEDGTVVGGEPWYLLPEGEPNIVASDTGDYFIVLCDEGHNELTRYGFNVSFDYWLYEGQDLILVHTNSAVFSFNVPYTLGAKYIEVWDSNDNVMFSKTVSSHSPSVGVIYPNGGEILTIGEEHTLIWEADDIDGDSLLYSVDYNVEGGNWIPIDWDLVQEQCIWNTSNLTPGENYRIRIMANDGANIAVDSSDATFSLTLGYLRGDANEDGEVNLADAVYLVNYLFIGGPPPDPMEAGDANCDGEVDLADAVYIINYLFIGGPPPGC
jgi:hypothetical protein